MPLFGGFLAMLVTLAVLRQVWLGLFASGGGLMIAAVIAHVVATAVAGLLDVAASSRKLTDALRRMMVAAVCGVVLWIAWQTIFVALIYASPRVFFNELGTVTSAAAAYALCFAGPGRLDPAWRQNSGPLGVMVLALMLLYPRTIPPLSNTGGPNTPAPSSPR
jgi:hypothetical protein